MRHLFLTGLLATSSVVAFVTPRTISSSAGGLAESFSVPSARGVQVKVPPSRTLLNTVPVDQSSSETAPPSSSESESKDGERRLMLLNDALLSFNSSAAVALVAEISGMRNSGINQETIDTCVNNILADGPDRALPLWAKARPLARFSKRARLVSLRRALDASTPPATESDNEEADDITSQQRRRRRALVSLLRSLAEEPDEKDSKGPAIVQIERKAKRAQSSTDDLRLRLPEGLETPKYNIVVERQGKYEVRKYESFAVCSVSMSKPRPEDSYKTDATISEPKMSGARGFGALAGYLFGKNQQETAMKMTTPVLTNGDGDNRQMSFVLPSEFWLESGLELAPKPMDGSGVKLERNMGGERAVVMFGGYASKTEVDKRKEKLLDSLAKDKDWEADATEPVALAQYNDPFTPPWKRLNEVSVRVQPRT